jgi:drug/metabolite transporter (DMT)-like permease
VCLIWGTTYLGIKVAIETIPPFFMAGARWMAAGLLLAALLKLRHLALPARGTWGVQALLGVLLIGLGNGAVVWAEQSVPSGLVALLIAVTPFWMVGIDRVRHQSDRLTWPELAGLALGFGGVVLLVWPEIRSARGSAFLAGVAATQVAAFGWALGSVYSRAQGEQQNVLAAVALQMIFGGLFLLAISVAVAEPVGGPYSGRSVAATLYLLFIGSIVAYSAYAYALRHLPITTVAMYAYVTPVIAVFLGTAVLGEPFSTRIAVASALVLGSVVMTRRV